VILSVKSKSNCKKLLEDRIEFKFYAAEKHLQILSDMEAKERLKSEIDELTKIL
jgi:hypothetical protein